MRAWCSWPEEGVRSLETAVTDGCELPWVLGTEPMSSLSFLSFPFLSSPPFLCFLSLGDEPHYVAQADLAESMLCLPVMSRLLPPESSSRAKASLCIFGTQSCHLSPSAVPAEPACTGKELLTLLRYPEGLTVRHQNLVQHAAELVQDSETLLLPNARVVEPRQPGLPTNRGPALKPCTAPICYQLGQPG